MPTLLRPATWNEVAALFHGAGGLQQAFKNAAGWAARLGVDPHRFSTGQVKLESWSADELAEVMDEMSAVEPRMTVDMVDGVNNAALPPRIDGLPAVVVRFGDRVGMIDGKHRANRWKQTPGQYAVLVVQC